MNKNTLKIAQIGLLIALEVVLSRMLSINTQFFRISFSFIPIALIAIQYGWIYSGFAAVIADIIGAVLFPTGPYFPGFTLTAFLCGALFGLTFYKNKFSDIKLVFAVLINILILQLGLNTVWLSILYEKGILLLLPTRIGSNTVMFILEMVIIFFIREDFYPRLQKQLERL